MRYVPINSSIPEGTRPGKHTKNIKKLMDESGWPLRSGSLTYFHDDGQQTASWKSCFQMGSRRNPGSSWDRYSTLICFYKHWQICWKPVCFGFCAGYLRLGIKLFIFSLAEHVDVTMALGWYNNPHWQLQRPPLAEMPPRYWITLGVGGCHWLPTLEKALCMQNYVDM